MDEKKRWSEDGGWNPYLAGGLSGVVTVFSVWVTGKYVGASTSFVRTAGMIEEWFVPQHVQSLEYFAKEVPKIDWQWMFVVGIVLGAFLASVTSRSFLWRALPDMWIERFGEQSLGRRAGFAFFGGVVAMFGARLAGG